MRGWDLAGSKKKYAKYTARVKMTYVNGIIIIEDGRRLRGSPGEVETLIKNTTSQDGKYVAQDIPQDPGQAGIAQKRYLAMNLHGFIVLFSPESGSKEDRARPLAAQAQAGNVKLLAADWNEAFLSELETFPRGLYSDQVDASSRAYARIVEMLEEERPIVDIIQEPEIEGEFLLE